MQGDLQESPRRKHVDGTVVLIDGYGGRVRRSGDRAYFPPESRLRRLRRPALPLGFHDTNLGMDTFSLTVVPGTP
jgi:hypothetical protein